MLNKKLRNESHSELSYLKNLNFVIFGDISKKRKETICITCLGLIFTYSVFLFLFGNRVSQASIGLKMWVGLCNGMVFY